MPIHTLDLLDRWFLRWTRWARGAPGGGDSGTMQHRQFWIEDDAGFRVRIGIGGILLGRDERCDVVTRTQQASRQHAMLRPVADGLELIHLGKNPTLVNGEPAARQVLLSDGDRLEVPGGGFRVVSAPAEREPQVWHLEVDEQHLYAIIGSPFLVGGGDGDDLTIPTWPAGALQFHVAQGALLVEGNPGVSLGDTALPVGELVSLQPGDQLQAGEQRVRVIASGSRDQVTTAVDPTSALPTRAELEFLPQGGRLTLEFPRDRHSAWLSELRADLIATLLQPPGELVPGDFVPDELLITRVWPGHPEKGKRDLNLLVFWARKALLAAGINGLSLIERAPRGGATRFRLSPDAEAAVVG